MIKGVFLFSFRCKVILQMAGIESLEQLMTKFNDFYVNKKYSDVVISVIENDSLLTRGSVSVEKGTVLSTINTHAIILDVNS